MGRSEWEERFVMADDMEKIGREENEDSRAYPVACPVTGEVIPLSQIPDSTFASGISAFTRCLICVKLNSR